MSAWYKDFIWTRRGVTVRETGTYVPLNTGVIKDFLLWLVYYAAEQTRNIFRSGANSSFTVSFMPRPARPWYLLRVVLIRARGKIINNTQKADLSIQFHDKTEMPAFDRPQAGQYMNFDCTDISKSYVASVFESVFGYPLSVDPVSHSGDMVKKSERNGAHDGSIITGPTDPETGWVYQHAIDNITENNTVRDLRCPTIGGHIPLIYIKERPADRRFDNLNTSCMLATPESQFSEAERSLVSQFCQKMGLDWGGLDILRDNTTQRIYIVDVNKTDMGPPLALPMKDKLTSTTILANALTDFVKGQSA